MPGVAMRADRAPALRAPLPRRVPGTGDHAARLADAGRPARRRPRAVQREFAARRGPARGDTGTRSDGPVPLADIPSPDGTAPPGACRAPRAGRRRGPRRRPGGGAAGQPYGPPVRRHRRRTRRRVRATQRHPGGGAAGRIRPRGRRAGRTGRRAAPRRRDRAGRTRLAAVRRAAARPVVDGARRRAAAGHRLGAGRCRPAQGAALDGRRAASAARGPAGAARPAARPQVGARPGRCGARTRPARPAVRTAGAGDTAGLGRSGALPPDPGGAPGRALHHVEVPLHGRERRPAAPAAHLGERRGRAAVQNARATRG